eukprot:TRINITY_DN51593_c0_g1_i1.p1 TRINITY_DN51593_c0_g1~~TRINITY_DN51593_c0_g1_i1.p1  ORF type:complete len:253 (+),score=58.51 TRINITY_DN51593_c0_g1_i1:219-977(+)
MEEEPSMHATGDPSKRNKPRRVKIHMSKLRAEQWQPCDPMICNPYMAKRPHRSFLVVARALGPRDIALVNEAARGASSVACNDRHRKLDFQHQVWRIERSLKEGGDAGRELYERLLRMMVWADNNLWGKLEKRRKVYPEIEFISYDATAGGPKYIEPHIDNDSVVTLVAMLTPREQFCGGVNYFKGTQSGEPDRGCELGCGDVVMFRGEALTHWISPVTSGLRTILPVSYTHLRAHETPEHLVCRLLLEKKK